MIVQSYGVSVLGKPLLFYHTKDTLPSSLPSIWILGGIHGDERGATQLVENCLYKWGYQFPQVLWIPQVNPDGIQLDTRLNARGVDLNRNFPGGWQRGPDQGSYPLSEPESKALYRLLHKYPPQIILSLHWALGQIDCDNEEAIILAQKWKEKLLPYQKQGQLNMEWVVSGTVQQPLLPGSWGHTLALMTHNNNSPSLTHKTLKALTLELPWHPEGLPGLKQRPNDHLIKTRELFNRSPSLYLASMEPLLYTFLQAANERVVQ